jgi:hypothetical protein
VSTKAVADRVGTAELAVPRRLLGGASICRRPGEEEDGVPVETTTIDELTADWPRVDIIKIDAEGAEEAIWAGMRRTLRRSPGLTVFMEVAAVRYADPPRFFASIESEGFPLRVVAGCSAVRPVSPAELLERPAEDVMLYLRRDAGG